jgi:pilus assembly protein Flp/PilA
MGGQLMLNHVMRFERDESGANALEYALVMILVAFVIVTGAALLGTNLESLFNSVGTQISAVVVPNF